MRRLLAGKVYAHTAAYDAAIASWFASQRQDKFPSTIVVSFDRALPLRYGENPGQDAAFYVERPNAGLAGLTQRGGKELSFNNLLEDCRRERDVRVDFAKHASSMGALAERVRSTGDLEAAFARAKAADRTYVIVIDVHAHQWTPGDAWWDVGVPEVSAREAVQKARAEHEQGAKKQRIGV